MPPSWPRYPTFSYGFRFSHNVSFIWFWFSLTGHGVELAKVRWRWRRRWGNVPAQIQTNAQVRDSSFKLQAEGLKPVARLGHSAPLQDLLFLTHSWPRTHNTFCRGPSSSPLPHPQPLAAPWVSASISSSISSSSSFFIHLQSHNLYYLHRRLCFGFSYGNGFSYGFSYSPAFRFSPFLCPSVSSPVALFLHRHRHCHSHTLTQQSDVCFSCLSAHTLSKKCLPSYG